MSSAAEHDELQVFVKFGLLAPLELSFAHRTRGRIEHIDLDHGPLINDVEAAVLRDRLDDDLLDDIEVIAERTREPACVKRPELGDDVDVVDRPWLSMNGAGKRAPNRPLDAELIEHLGDSLPSVR